MNDARHEAVDYTTAGKPLLDFVEKSTRTGQLAGSPHSGFEINDQNRISRHGKLGVY